MCIPSILELELDNELEVLLKQPVDSNILAKFLSCLLLGNLYIVLILEITLYSIMGGLRVGVLFVVLNLPAMPIAFRLVAARLPAFCLHA